MATLVELPQDVADRFPAYKMGDDPMTHINKESEVYEELTKNHKMIQVPYADGYAVYLIVNEKPLRIAHVPIGDGWHLPATFIRGLRFKDIRFTDWMTGKVTNIGRVNGGGLPCG